MGSRVLAPWEQTMALAMLAALATQIRIGGAGVGVGLLMTALLPAFLAALWRGPGSAPSDSLVLFGFWAVFVAAMCLGAINSIARAIPLDVSLVVHDMVAYSLLILFTLTLATLPNRKESIRKMQWGVALLGAAIAALQFANAYDLFSLPDVDPWYWDRMRGWAENPNQFALFSLLAGFCALSLVDKAASRGRRAAALLCCAITLTVGLQAKSNAYTLMVAAGLLAYLLLKGLRALLAAERRGYPAIGVALMVVSTLGIVLTIASAGIDLRANFKSFASEVARKGDDESADAALRLELWRRAVAVGSNSGGLGLGPGPHLEIPPGLIAARKSEDRPKYIAHPKEGIAANFEAHNTALELFVQGGVLAFGAFVFVLATAVRRAWRAGEDGVIALVAAAVAFGSFHVVFRHPLVWFCLCLGVLAEGRPSAAVAPAGDRLKARLFCSHDVRR